MACSPAIVKDWRGFKVAFQQHSIHSIKTQLIADLACDLLAVQQAIDAGRTLDTLALRGRRSDHSRPQPSAATLAELRAVAFEEVVRQLQGAVHALARPLEGISLHKAHTGADAATHLLFSASSGGFPTAVHLLLLTWPETATATDDHGSVALHAAAGGGHTAAMRLLLAAFPGAAMLANRWDCLPIHRAAAAHAGGREVEAIALLLAHAPQSAAVASRDGQLPLHLAAAASRWSKSPEAVQLLLQHAPAGGAVPRADGFTPLHCAAAAGHVPTIQAILDAAPATATARATHGCLPLHCAAEHGNAAAVALLLQAAPEAATAYGRQGRLPLELALGGDTLQSAAARQAAARCLLGAGPAAVVLSALRRVGPLRGLPLVPELVAARMPLSEAEWECVPYKLPGLGAALPAALAHSRAQACFLMRCLPRSDLLRLRTFALCMARVQRRELHATLPPEILQQLLCLSVGT